MEFHDLGGIANVQLGGKIRKEKAKIVDRMKAHQNVDRKIISLLVL